MDLLVSILLFNNSHCTGSLNLKIFLQLSVGGVNLKMIL